MAKRIFDIVLAFISLCLLSPVVLMLFFVIRINMGSPVLFKQIRPGVHGRPFLMYKFRTMTQETSEEGELLPDAMRLNKVGEFLRKYSLDEIPELINIIKGEMSFVGPRPLLIKDYVFFDDEVLTRQNVLPGITGLAQIKGRNGISWEDKFKYDLEYVEKQSLIYDIIIILKTFGVVFSAKGVNMPGHATSLDYGDYLLQESKIEKADYHKKIEEAETILREYGKY